MLLNLYIHNYKCFQNFNFDTDKEPSLLIVGKNGVGKTCLMEVLNIFQAIGRGEHRIEKIVNEESLTLWNKKKELLFEMNVNINSNNFKYKLCLEMPENFYKFRIKLEELIVNKTEVLKREPALVSLNNRTEFSIDWHYVALPLIFDYNENKHIITFRNWLANMLLLSPIPHIIKDISDNETEYLTNSCENFIDFFINQINKDYSLFQNIQVYVRSMLDDFNTLKSVSLGERIKRLDVSFNNIEKDIRFSHLSHGEKIFLIHAVVVALATKKKDLFVFWDEPDSYLARGEIQAFIRQLRATFAKKNQIIMTSHCEDTVRSFSKENTRILERSNHSSPVNIKKISPDVDFLDAVEEAESGYLL